MELNNVIHNVSYKTYSFSFFISPESGEILPDFLNTSQDSDIDDFCNDVFFQDFTGETVEDAYDDKIIRKVKRRFARYIRDNVELSEEETTTEETTTPTKKQKPEGAIDRIIFETVERALGSDASRNEIDALIKELIKENGVIPHRKVLEIKLPDEEGKKDVGLQHKDFEKILKSISMGVNLALVGPAGSGKTTIVSNVAKALKLDFSSQSVSTQSTTFDFFGYKNAKGDYVGTMFRDRYEKGGVFLLDEFDAGNPNVLAALNQATANSHCPFPDKMVERHKDFIIVMAGNTFGGGGTIDYVGRNKIDAATLDRFAFIYIDYDEQLEENLAVNKGWCIKVQEFRRRAAQKKIRTIISPRATFNGEKLLEAGLSIQEVEEMVIYKGLTKDERNLLNVY